MHVGTKNYFNSAQDYINGAKQADQIELVVSLAERGKKVSNIRLFAKALVSLATKIETAEKRGVDSEHATNHAHLREKVWNLYSRMYEQCQKDEAARLNTKKTLYGRAKAWTSTLPTDSKILWLLGGLTFGWGSYLYPRSIMTFASDVMNFTMNTPRLLHNIMGTWPQAADTASQAVQLAALGVGGAVSAARLGLYPLRNFGLSTPPIPQNAEEVSALGWSSATIFVATVFIDTTSQKFGDRVTRMVENLIDPNAPTAISQTSLFALEQTIRWLHRAAVVTGASMIVWPELPLAVLHKAKSLLVDYTAPVVNFFANSITAINDFTEKTVPPQLSLGIATTVATAGLLYRNTIANQWSNFVTSSGNARTVAIGWLQVNQLRATSSIPVALYALYEISTLKDGLINLSTQALDKVRTSVSSLFPSKKEKIPDQNRQR